jgi:hypothetical protein
MLTNATILPRWLIVLLVPSLALLVVVLWSSPHKLAPLYYGTMAVIGWGILGQGRWRGFQARLQNLPGPVWLRCICLGYLAVIFEESLVGTLYALAEGNWPGQWLPRMGQFIGFNLFAFTGAIIGLTIAYGRYPGLRPWHLVLAGVWGLFAERTWLIFWGNPMAGSLLFAPNMAVYSLILAPIMLSLPDRPRSGTGHDPARAPVWALFPVWALMFLLSLPAVAALLTLRAAVPDAFPSCEYIGC